MRRDAVRVVDEVLSRASELTAVAALGGVEGATDEVAVDVGVVRLDGREQLLHEVLVVLLSSDDGH